MTRNDELAALEAERPHLRAVIDRKKFVPVYLKINKQWRTRLNVENIGREVLADGTRHGVVADRRPASRPRTDIVPEKSGLPATRDAFMTR